MPTLTDRSMYFLKEDNKFLVEHYQLRTIDNVQNGCVSLQTDDTTSKHNIIERDILLTRNAFSILSLMKCPKHRHKNNYNK